MKKLFTTLAASAVLAVGFSVPTVSADSANWSAEKIDQVGQNRCANAGKGNGAERYIKRTNRCLKRPNRSEDWRRDSDPGVPNPKPTEE
jgi:hypothetical protein